MNSREQRIADFRAGMKWQAELSECFCVWKPDEVIAEHLGPQDDSIQRAKEEMLMMVARRDACAGALAEVDVMLNDADIPAHVRGPLRDALRRMPGWNANPSQTLLAANAVSASKVADPHRRHCERVFLYQLAKWLNSDLLNAPISLANSITDMLAIGQPEPPAKEEPK